jgi:hypothetical protein
MSNEWSGFKYIYSKLYERQQNSSENACSLTNKLPVDKKASFSTIYNTPQNRPTTRETPS